MIKMPAIFFILFTSIHAAFSQATIKGVVLNHAGGEPLAGSSVFINNSSKGVVSGKNGEFELAGIPPGKHDLIISSIGFETTVFSFHTDQLPLQLRIEMRVKVRELENVTVEPSVEESWARWGKVFMESFVGITPNAAGCKLKNHKAVRFRFFKKSNRIIAFADEPLVLENKRLGYKISYQLEEFEINFKTGATVYAGYPFFEDMGGDKKKWSKNREEAYYGSMLHFMRSLYYDKLADEGFEVRRMKRLPNLEKERVKGIYALLHQPSRRQVGSNGVIKNPLDSLPKDSVRYYEAVLRQKDYRELYGANLLTADSILAGEEDKIKILLFPDYLHITFKRETEDKAYLMYFGENRKPAFQQSLIWLASMQPVSVVENGSYYPPQEIFSAAYWAWEEKLANLLPIDYLPGEKGN